MGAHGPLTDPGGHDSGGHGPGGHGSVEPRIWEPNKLPTAKLLACIHGMQKGDGGEGGQGRVVSGKGQILTTYRGPSSREREGGGGEPTRERGKTPTQPGGGVGQWHDLPPWRKAAAATTEPEAGGIRFYPGGPQNGCQECRATPGELGGRSGEWVRATMKHARKRRTRPIGYTQPVGYKSQSNSTQSNTAQSNMPQATDGD